MFNYYYDSDGDGVGSGNAQQFCNSQVPDGYVSDNGDECPNQSDFIELDACGDCDDDDYENLGTQTISRNCGDTYTWSFDGHEYTESTDITLTLTNDDGCDQKKRLRLTIEEPPYGYDCDGQINLEVGDEMQGGILFYIDDTGENGLVICDDDEHWEDSDMRSIWRSTNITYIGADNDGLGTWSNSGVYSGGGKENTEKAMEITGSIYSAIYRASNYEKDGYNDWWLPSIGEWVEMKENLSSELNSLGISTTSAGYWTSTEMSISHVKVGLRDSNQTISNSGSAIKTKIKRLRPIRATTFE